MQLNAQLLSSPPNESPDENFLRSPLVMPHQQVVRHIATKLQWYIQLQSYSDTYSYKATVIHTATKLQW